MLHNDGCTLTVGLRITTQTAAPIRRFMIAHNVLDHQITEHLEFQYAVILTTGSTPKMHVPFNTSATHAKALNLASPVLTGD